MKQLVLFSTAPSFKQVQEQLNNIPNINCGGCGIAALGMLLWLKKHEPARARKTKIVFGYYFHEEMDHNNRAKKNNVSPETPAHCWLKIDGVEQDSKGKISGVPHPYIHTVGIKFLRRTIKKGCWNVIFRRKEYVPIIENALGIKFGDCIIQE